MSLAILPTILCLAAAAGLVVAECRGARQAQWFLKPVAALAFVLQALVLAPFESLYGGLILGALVLSALGDGLLLPRDHDIVFRFGMASFGLAHVVYGCAFLSFPIYEISATSLTGAFLAPLLVICTVRWLAPRLGFADRLAVFIYSGLIGIMVASAFHVAGRAIPVWVALAALMFAVSDLFVARDRFIAKSPWNSVAITPLYFGAQCLFALSIGAV